MPNSVHKLLIHGPLIAQHAILPIGELSEEAKKLKIKILGKTGEKSIYKSKGRSVPQINTKYRSIFECLQLWQKKLKQIPDAMRQLIIP